MYSNVKNFKDEELHLIQIRLIILYVLNFTDILFTYLLLKTGMFAEANTFMQPVVTNMASSVITKIVLPLMLLIFINFRMKRATLKQINQGKKIINIGILYYGLINISHVVWIIVYMVLH